MGLFKRAAARGVAYELVRQGLVSFPTKEAMFDAADAVADNMPGPEGAMMDPGAELTGEAGPSLEEAAQMANELIEIAEGLLEQAGLAGKTAAEAFSKSAAEAAIETMLSEAVIDCMQKTAEEVKQAGKGALMHGGDAQNTPQAAAQTDSVADMDEKDRPQGTYQVPMGETGLDSMQGHVGALDASTKGPTNSPSGETSVSADAKKSAALCDLVRKHANALVGVGEDKKNTPAAAASSDSVAELDLKARPEGYALVGQGNTNIKEEAAARIGKEQPHPVGPSNSPAGSNSVTDASKVAADDAFVVVFTKCAEDVGPYLPKDLSEDEKVAAIRRMMGMDRPERQEYLTALHEKQSSLLNRIRGVAHQATT